MTTSSASPSRPTLRQTGRARRVLAATAALALLALAGACSAGGGSDAASSSSAGEVAPQPATAERANGAEDSLSYDAGASDERSALASSSDTSSGKAASPVADNAAGDARSLIKTGNVALRSDDVPTARFDVGKVLDAHGGEIAEENTQADDDGEAERVRLVLRVPVAEFDATMTGLKGVADLIDVTTSTQDVSTEVIDNDVRVALQKRSIDRISILLDNAADLRDIVSIERELSNREADLGSLEKRQTFLADQTAMATITVSIEPPKDKPEKTTPKDDESGFLAGLDGGWSALKSVTTGLLTVGGAVLPFALVLLAIAVPGRIVVRRLVRRMPATAPAAPAAPAP